MLIETTEQFERAIRRMEQTEVIVLDTETNGLYPYMSNRIIGISIYLPEYDESYYFPFRHGEGFNWPVDNIQYLHKALTQKIEYYGWNVKFDLHFLQVEGFPILQNHIVYNDVMIALHMLDENRNDMADERGLNYKLKDNARLFLGAESAEAEDELVEEMKLRGIKGKDDMWKLPAYLVNKYAEDDVRLTWQLLQLFIPYLEKWSQLELFYEKCKYNSTILARMENYGTPVDHEKINDHIQSNSVRVTELLESLRRKFGEKFNPNSPQQVSKALDTVNAKKATLSMLGDEDAEAIMEYKFRTKAEGTFYKPYLWYSAFDGKIHPTFNVTRTVTGRLSSSDPNLQQVPRFTEKYRVKEVFVAPKGYVLVQADYAQQELRLACNFSGQENMIALFEQGRDLHSYTAAYLFGIDEQWLIDEIKNGNKKAKEFRHIGKTANFGFLYGMGVSKAALYLSENLKRNVPEKEAKKIVYGWRDLYPRFVTALQNCSTAADSLRNPDGTSARLDEGYKYYRLEDTSVRHYIKGQRPFTAWNYLIQGTGGMIMRKALLRIDKIFPIEQDEVIPAISVHDSVVAFVSEDVVDKSITMIKDAMENFPQYYPPMKVDIQIGKDWGNLE